VRDVDNAKEVPMIVRLAVLGALAAAMAVTSVAAAGPDVAKQRTKQRIGLMTRNGPDSSSAARFVLTPLEPGAIKRDSGTTGDTVIHRPRVVVRGGQKVTIYYGIVETLRGKRGTLVTRSRIEYVDAGNGYHVGQGIWKVVRGTGQYAKLTGGGRRGDVWVDNGPWSGYQEGFLTLKRR
jgi:hypothetical protein